MDRIRGPLYSGPIFPIDPRTRQRGAPRRIKGRVVGVRPGRSGEVGATQIITIKLDEPYPEVQRLLHMDVEILIQGRS